MPRPTNRVKKLTLAMGAANNLVEKLVMADYRVDSPPLFFLRQLRKVLQEDIEKEIKRNENSKN